MATPTENAMAQCAACGKGGESLKKCTACKLVKYCGVDCQRAHRPKHKKECKRRAAELRDEELFKQPPSREDCPICFLELPFRDDQIIYQACCGKFICKGCVLATSEQSVECPLCPFCRTPIVHTQDEVRKQLEKRIELNDAQAIAVTGYDYALGTGGLQQNINKALELFQKATEYGSINAHDYLGTIYFSGDGVQVDEEKVNHHLEIAAIGGHVGARYNLGVVEEKNNGNHHRAVKHWIISATAGHDKSLKEVQNGYRLGLVTKDDFEKTLRAHKKSKDELKSEWRDKAKAFADQDGAI